MAEAIGKNFPVQQPNIKPEVSKKSGEESPLRELARDEVTLGTKVKQEKNLSSYMQKKIADLRMEASVRKKEALLFGAMGGALMIPVAVLGASVFPPLTIGLLGFAEGAEVFTVADNYFKGRDLDEQANALQKKYS
ncbi:MAG: hypothetical protein M1536_05610 [Firmicutes bacterium]|nr:hypothetical protein [Bacillota bacterium]